MADQLSDWAREYFRQVELQPPPGAHAFKPAKHARLGFSGADRWIPCPASVRASEGLPDRVTPYAREGSAAHEVAAHCLVDQTESIDWLGKMIDLGDEGPMIEVDEMMVAGVQKYLEKVWELSEYGFNPDIALVVEHRGSLQNYDPAFFEQEPIFGTCDVRIYNRKTRRLTIVDFKYGYRYVGIEGKPQTRGYALMEITSDELKDEPIEEIELMIVQPRSPSYEGEPFRSQVITVDELLTWADETMMPAARRTQDPDAPFVPGDHCVFCRYAPHCLALRQLNFDDMMIALKPNETMPVEGTFGTPPAAEQLTIDQLARLVAIKPRIENWLKAVSNHAFGLANAGVEIVSDDGKYAWKLVARRGRRKWVGEEEDVRLALAVDWGVPSEYQDHSKLVSPAQLEVKLKELYGRKWRAISTEIQKKGLVETRSSGVSLVPLDDKREKVMGVELAMFTDLDKE